MVDNEEEIKKRIGYKSDGYFSCFLCKYSEGDVAQLRCKKFGIRISATYTCMHWIAREK